jgi:hypothetical protein
MTKTQLIGKLLFKPPQSTGSVFILEEIFSNSVKIIFWSLIAAMVYIEVMLQVSLVFILNLSKNNVAIKIIIGIVIDHY